MAKFELLNLRTLMICDAALELPLQSYKHCISFVRQCPVLRFRCAKAPKAVWLQRTTV